MTTHLQPLRFTGGELVKIARLPLVWAVIILCALVNLLMAATATPANTVARYNYASAVAVAIGGKVGPEFDRALALIGPSGGTASSRGAASSGSAASSSGTTPPDTETVPDVKPTDPVIIARIPKESTMTADELHRQLTAITRGATNTLAGYDATATRDAMLAQVAGDPAATWLMQRKYDVYAARVAHLASTGAALDLAAGSATDPTLNHWTNMTGYLFFETCTLAVLLMALALGYERTAGTEQLMMATRVGRRLVAPKIAAGLIASTIAYLLLVAAIVIPYLMVFDVRGVWSASVTSQFNTVFGQRPFVTWWDLTIGQYLFVRLALGLAITLCFALFTATLGLLMRNTFAVAGCVGIAVILVIGIVGAAHATGLPWVAWIGGFNPVGVLLLREQWFTELGLDAPSAFWETGVTACSLVYLTAALAAAWRAFRHRNLAA